MNTPRVAGAFLFRRGRHRGFGLENPVNHEEHEVHEEKQQIESAFTSWVIADTACIFPNSFVFFVRFVVCAEVLSVKPQRRERAICRDNAISGTIPTATIARAAVEASASRSSEARV